MANQRRGRPHLSLYSNGKHIHGRVVTMSEGYGCTLLGDYDQLMCSHSVFIMQPSRLRTRSNPTSASAPYLVLNTNFDMSNYETALSGVYICTRSTQSPITSKQPIRLRRTPLEMIIEPAIKRTSCLYSPYRMKMESVLPQKLRDLLAWSKPIAISSRLPNQSHRISSIAG